jgi:hypothetical protein
MILDAGCGNRAMWLQKNHEQILHIDIEKHLQRKPDLFASNTNLPFPNECFQTVFFDPPFCWNNSTHPLFSFPNREKLWKKYPNIREDSYPPQYYGIERYKTRSQLVKYLYVAQKELYRVLKPDGCLWLRWCNMASMTHHHVLGIFENWTQMLFHEIGSSKRNTGGKTESFWFMLMKKPLDYIQCELSSELLANKEENK